MKKTLVLPIILIVAFLFIATFVDFDDQSGLPDGKNYIDSSNLYYKEGYIYTTKPMVAKGETRYTFSISRYYVDGAPFEVIIDLYNNERVIRRVTEHDGTMDFDIETNTFYFTFMTTPDTNQFTLQMTDRDDFTIGEEFTDVQLEEGSAFTTYEPYIDKLSPVEIVFYTVSGSVIFISLAFAIGTYFFSKSKISKKKQLTNKKKKKQVTK